jgi:hypothetical protein
MAEEVWAEQELAERLRAEADALRERFNGDYWRDERGGFYVVGLNGAKRQVDSKTSNMGHLLWSGIVPPDRAETIVQQLFADAMFTGWGIRTLSTENAGYNPIGYHRGTVWPHDNSIISAGLARYGYREEANRLAMAMFEASAFTDYRLPEVFAGYPRSRGRFPVRYPTACSPQAWTTAAPFLWLRTMLGIDARDGTVTCDPVVPEEVGSLAVHWAPRLRRTVRRDRRGHEGGGGEVMTENEQKVSALLHEAGETHHSVYRIVDGADDDWATWYSNWLANLSELPDLLGTKPVRSELTYLLVRLDKEYVERKPDEPWEDYYARELVRHFAGT